MGMRMGYGYEDGDDTGDGDEVGVGMGQGRVGSGWDRRGFGRVYIRGMIRRGSVR